MVSTFHGDLSLVQYLHSLTHKQDLQISNHVYWVCDVNVGSQITIPWS